MKAWNSFSILEQVEHSEFCITFLIRHASSIWLAYTPHPHNSSLLRFLPPIDPVSNICRLPVTLFFQIDCAWREQKVCDRRSLAQHHVVVHPGPSVRSASSQVRKRPGHRGQRVRLQLGLRLLRLLYLPLFISGTTRILI